MRTFILPYISSISTSLEGLTWWEEIMAVEQNDNS